MSGSALNLGSSHAFRLVLDAVPVPCWIHYGGVVQYANPALARLLGEEHGGSIAGRCVVDLLSPKSREVFDFRTTRLLAGEEVPRHEEEFQQRSGGSVSVEIVSSVISYDGTRAILTFFHDITEQRRAEAARHISEIRYRRLIESNIVGVFEFTADRILEANDCFLELIGRTREEFPGGRFEWRLVSPPEDEQRDRENVGELIATGEVKPFEKEFLRPDGGRVPVLMGAYLVERGPAWRGVALAIDLTDRRKLLETEQERLRLESIGVLAAGMAHNLNNILTGVLGNASLLADHGLVAPETRAAVVAREIVHAGERAAALTAQLLAYSGRGRFLVGPVDLAETIRSEIDALRPELPDNIRIDIKIPPDLPALEADLDHLRHLVVALVENAVEAIGSREGAVTVAARVEWIHNGGILSRLGEPLPPGDYCVIEVRDDGAGMDSNTLAHAFDPFFSTKFPGRGLGLAAVSGIVRAAGGAIRVSSAPRLGSVFQVYLPVR